MISKKLSAICIISMMISVLFLGSYAFGAGKAIKYRYGSASFPGLPTHAGNLKFAELINERSNGKYHIDAIQERKLGGDKDMIELVSSGAIQMGNCSTALFDVFFPDLNALQLPFLIKGYDTLEKVFLADFTKELISKLEKLNLHPLGLHENGFRHIGNNLRAINTPADLKGIKIRVAETKMHQEIFQSLGAIPIPISYGEIYTSLKTGVIDGTEINATSASSEKLMEVLKYFSTTGHFFWPSVTFINKGVWDKMSPEDQKLFEDVWRETIPWQINLCKERDKKAFEIMKKKGIKINQADAKKFFEGAKFVYDKYTKTPEVAKFVKAVQALQK
jgi:tripartite ATP-independent transporter DctP family solute receptor